ncbi:catalase family peroxidase [Elioraea rosea]|uniref:catalase family peroxidase n=1 Tax=Elioraea rosea TaxID=2492390 RepID=UPI001183533D|nr:catalase family peroxidase [Elioraea rosea]
MRPASILGRLLRGSVALALAATLFEPVPASASDQKTIAEQLVDAFEGVFGVHAGARRSGAKGVCATGEFIATGAAAHLTKAATLREGVRAPVLARFSVGGGNPNAPDASPSVRGLSFAIEGPGGEAHEFVLINAPVFGARTPESFLTFLRVRQADPATGRVNAEAVAAANAAHPDWAPQMAYLRENAPPASYATAPYFGVNSFVLVDAAGARRHARWTFEPVAGRVGLTAEERASRPRDFLDTELRDRLGRGPAEWRVLLTLAAPGDAVDDAVTAWPADRETLQVGLLRITAADAAGTKGACDGRFFNPTLLPDGIEPSNDPILTIRAEVYAVSLSRRSN